MEVRPIDQSEVETFLRLLCEVFELDYHHAHSVFVADPFFDCERKWALFADGGMRSILTTTPLEFGWGRAIGISGVATQRRYQGSGFGRTLIEAVVSESERRGEGACYLFAPDPRLYERTGFAVVDEVVRGPIRAQTPFRSRPALTTEQVHTIYTIWSNQHPDRLRRNEVRWQHWGWHMRPCEPFAGGYLCLEVTCVREAVGIERQEAWPVVPGTDWVGLRGLAEVVGVPLESATRESFLMARGTDRRPQMFLTDQF